MKRLALVVLVACEGGRSPDPMPIEIVNGGTACMRGSEPFEFAADEPIQVKVEWDEICLSSSCTSDRMSSCRVSLSEQTITIETHASFTDSSATGIACTDDCGILVAHCDTPILAAGNYVFRLGPTSIPITVPSSPLSQPCLR